MGKNKKRKNKVEKTQKPEEIQKNIPLTGDSDSGPFTENDVIQPTKEKNNPALNDVQTVEELPEKAPAEITEEHSEENVEEDATVIAKENNTKTKRKKKDIFAFKKDIWYRGPLSYRHLKIIGWLCIVLSQVGNVLKIGKGLGMNVEIPVLSNESTMENISSLALPLLLISIFAFLLSKRTSYKEAIIIYAFLAFGLAGLFILFYKHYMLGILEPIIDTDKAGAEEFLTSFLFEETGFKGFWAFNIFIDLFVCTLIMFFTDYTPKRLFTGKRIIIFRAMVVLPILYEVACIYIKIMATNHLMALPLWVSPFLTTKPPVSMIMFFSVVRYMKMQEKRFLDTGRTEEEYKEYCKTNIHSFRFSKHLILIILIYAALDAGLFILLIATHIVIVDGIMDPTLIPAEAVENAVRIVESWGIGETLGMVDLIPVVLLFSYTRSHKIAMFDRLIPIIGVILIILVYFEAGFLLAQDWLWYYMPSIREKLNTLQAYGSIL